MINYFKLIIFFLFISNMALIAEDINLFSAGFGKGINKENEFIMTADEAWELQNISFDELGIMKRRKGWTRVGLTGDNNVINNMVAYKKYNSSDYVIASGDSYTYLITTSTIVKLPVEDDTSLSIAQDYKKGFWQVGDILYSGDGVNSNYKYSGTQDTVYKAGVSKPANITSLVNGDSGSIGKGLYKYVYAYVIDDAVWGEVIGQPSDVLSVQNAYDTGSVTITFTKSTDKLVNKINIYRTNADLSVYYLVTTINNDTTVYIDKTSDTDLDYLSGAFSLNRENLPSGKYGISYRNRVFVAGNNNNKSKVYFSFSDNPELYNPNTNFYDFGEYGAVTGLAVVNGHIIIFTERSTWALIIPDIEDIATWSEPTVLSKEVGCINHFSIANVENALIFASKDGIYSLGVQFASEKASNPGFSFIGLPIKNLFNEHIQNNYADLHAHYDNHTYRLAYSYNNSTYNNRELCFDINYQIWYENKGYSVNCYARNNDNVLFAGGSLSLGLVMRLDNGTNDGGYYYKSLCDTYTEDTTTMTILFKNVTFNTDSLIGMPVYYQTVDTGIFENFTIIDNDTTHITISGNFTENISNKYLYIGAIEYLRETGWIYTDNKIGQKKPRYLYLYGDLEDGDVNVYLYADNKSKVAELEAENALIGDLLTVNFTLGTSKLGGTGQTDIHKLFCVPYNIFEKMKLRFYSIEESALNIHQWVLFYEYLRFNFPQTNTRLGR